VGVSVLPGFQYSPDTLFYGRLGYSNTKLKIVTSDASLTNFNGHKDGFRWGLGAKRAVSQRLALRIEYSQTNYNSQTLGTVDPVSLVTKTTSINPLQQLVEFGIVYTI